MKKIGILILMLIILTLFIGAVQAPSSPMIDWWVLAGGGGVTSNGGSLSLNGTLGQPIASMCLNSGEFRLQSGYWSTGWAACGGAIYLPLLSR